MTRQVDEGRPWGRLFGKKDATAASAPPAKKKRQKDFRMARDDRQGMSSGGYLSQFTAAGPMTLEDLLARLTPDQRAVVVAMSADQQADLLRVYEAFDRHLQAPSPHKAAVLDRLGRSLTNGRLLADRRAHGGLLARLARRVGAAPVGPLRGRLDGLLLLSRVAALLAEPLGAPAADRSETEREVAALTHSLALAWPARWAEIALALAFDGSWQGVAPAPRAGGSLPDGLIQGSLLAYARTLPPDGELTGPASQGRAGLPGHVAAPGDLTLGQLDLLARILDIDRGAELDVEGRDPTWALAWLHEQLGAGVPARVGIVHEGRGLTVRVTSLSDRLVICDGLTLAPPAFLASLRRVIVDGEYLARVGLN